MLTKDDVFPEHKEVSFNLNRLSELLLEIDKVQTYLNKFGFNFDVKVNQKDLQKVI